MLNFACKYFKQTKFKTIEDIQPQISNLEGDSVEFKETTGQLERGMETLCAFLNGTGGTVLFGINDKGKVIGQEVSDTTKRNIADALRRFEPIPAVTISYIQLEGQPNRFVIVLSAEDANFDRPFTYKNKAYWRVESETVVMPQSRYNDLLLARDGVKNRWETYTNADISISDLDSEEILKTVRLGIEAGRLPESTGNDISRILENFNLYDSKSNLLRHSAMVLFGDKKIASYPQCLLRLARFRGTDKKEFIDTQRIRGNFFRLLDAAMAFIFKHLSLSAKIEGLEREEQLTIPYKAIREAIINALCHRDYRNAGGSVGIAIYDDRVEIDNPGSFPSGWNMDKIMGEHGSVPHNQDIAEVLFKRKVLENWGRGIDLIISECEKVNLPKPIYKISGNDITLIFRYVQPAPEQEPDKLPDKLPDKYPTSTRQVEVLLSALGNEEYSVKELLALLDLKNREHFVNNYLKPAIGAGLIEPLYPNQPRHPKQKYRKVSK